ncbi:PAS domain S-box protein [Haloparvum sp. PAK95]|uniref:PAS domain S-box protein n=1 Tax=Haloparvum sp. PAK95 TaxID=3418962 RepID=UPI003D2EA992
MSDESVPVTARSASEYPSEIRVLHVDDDAAILDLTREFLERAHERLSVTSVSDPTTVLDQLGATDPHCIVSDYDMPALDGLELFDQLQEHGVDRPFVLFTGKGSESIAADAMSAGVTDYIQKGGTDTYDVLANRVLEAVQSQQRKVIARQAVDHYTALVETSHLPVYHYDEAGRIRYANEAAVELFGEESVESLVGEEMFDYHPPEHREKVRSRVERLRTGDKVSPTELRFSTEGSTQVAKVSCAPTAFDDDAVGQTIAHDVTELQESERELAQLREIITEEFKSVDAGLWKHRVDDDRITRYGVSSLLGLEPDRLSDSFDSFIEHVHPDDRETLREAYVGASERGESFNVRFRVEQAADEVRYLEDRGHPVTDDEGRVTQVIGLLVDVTDNEHRKQRLERQREQFESIATTLSHDFQGPLQTLKGRLELARHSGDPREQVDEARSITARLEELVDGLARTVRAGKPVTDVEPVAVDAVATDAAHARSFPTDDLTVTADLTVEANRDALHRLFENLLGNALDHGGEDVSVDVGRLPDGFYVEDDGVGFPGPVADSLFEFGTTTAADGTGVGLASVKRIVGSHGWEIEAVDGDRGARFEITGAEVLPSNRDSKPTSQ